MTTVADSGGTPPSRSRLSEREAVEMYRDGSIHELGERAFSRCLEIHPEPYRTYIVDRNINYSNWCTAKCLFCNFKADASAWERGQEPYGHAAAGAALTGQTGKGVEGAGPEASDPSLRRDGYVLSFDEIGAKIQELIDIGGTQVLMQGGLAPPEILGFEWYIDLLRFIKRTFPSIHVHAFSPPEIFWFAQVFGMSIRDVLVRLRDAGLDTIPGGGAEILVDRVRDRISRGKTRTDEYLEVMRQAHRLGMRTTITMMFGHIETISERIEHLRRVRDLQDETGGFTAFICWTFQPENTALGRWKQPDISENVRFEIQNRLEPDGEHLVPAGAHDYLKTLAIARLFLDNIANVQASWVTQGPKIGQLALFFGANDMGSVMMEENVVSAAGTTYRLNEAEIRHLIADAGWEPKRRNCYYEIIE